MNKKSSGGWTGSLVQASSADVRDLAEEVAALREEVRQLSEFLRAQAPTQASRSDPGLLPEA